MTTPMTAHIELSLAILVIGFTAWVLMIQPLGLLRNMPKRNFIGLQMRLVRFWIRVLVPMTATLATLATVRLHSVAWPAIAAFISALVAAGWAVPRALRAGGHSLSSDPADSLRADGFLADGGGDGTRAWHRVVLLCVLGIVGGSVGTAHGNLHTASGRDHATAAPPVEGHRHEADIATVVAVRALETEVARLLAASGDLNTEPVTAAWRNIFESCTMQGEAHDQLHAFLTPIAPAIAQLAPAPASQRVAIARDVLSQLARFDDWFSVGG